MGTRKSILVAIVFVYVELCNAVHTLKVGESVERCLACSRDKLQKLGPFLTRESGDGTATELAIM